jgi:hypothetical protein
MRLSDGGSGKVKKKKKKKPADSIELYNKTGAFNNRNPDGRRAIMGEAGVRKKKKSVAPKKAGSNLLKIEKKAKSRRKMIEQGNALSHWL